ncbi:PQQ-binding-like beta-propeller repeat protein, partial [bacterium]|nr:PQQ-binding-like beta-propeller repeat protein [bacterium]
MIKKFSLTSFVVLLIFISIPAIAKSWNFKAGDIIYSISLNKEGTMVALGSRDGNVYLFDNNGNKLWTFQIGSTVNSVSISPDGNYIAIGSEDRCVYFLDRDGKLIWKHQFNDIISGVSVAERGNYISVSTSSLDKSLYLLDNKGTVIWKQNIGEQLYATAISPGGDLVLCGGRGAAVYAFDSFGKVLWSFQTDGYIRSIAISPDGKFIAVGSEDTNIYLIDTKGKEIWRYPTNDYVLTVGCANKGRLVVGGSRDKNLYILDKAGTLIRTFTSGQEVWAANVSPDGEVVYFGDFTGSFSGIDLAAAAASRAFRIKVYIGLGLGIATILILWITWILRNPIRRDQVQRKLNRVENSFKLVWKYKTMYLFVIPTILLLATFNYYPAFSGIYHAFTEWHPGGNTKWIGWENFRQMKFDPYLTVGIKNLIILLITNIIKVLTMPLLVAELIFHLKSARSQYWMRTAFVMPIVVPGIVGILLWTMIYDPNIGLLNQ